MIIVVKINRCWSQSINSFPCSPAYMRQWIWSALVQARNQVLKCSYQFEIWQAYWQHCCPGACQISEQSVNFKYKPRSFEALCDLTIRRLIGYWNRALMATITEWIDEVAPLKLQLTWVITDHRNIWNVIIYLSLLSDKLSEYKRPLEVVITEWIDEVLPDWPHGSGTVWIIAR